LVYPNPANDVINVKVDLTLTQDIKITISSLSGQVAYIQKYTMTKTDEFNINNQTLPAGLYFLNVQPVGSGAGKWTKSFRFVKK
jgi:hypothetical protein